MDAIQRILAAHAVHIADRNDLRAPIAEEAAEVSAPHHADTDEAEVDAVVRPLPQAFLGADVRIEDEWRRDGSRRCRQKTAPRDLLHGVPFLDWWLPHPKPRCPPKPMESRRFLMASLT